jgi:predicted membrane protein
LELKDKAKGKTIWQIHKFYDPDGLIAKLGEKGTSIQELIEKFKDRFIGEEKFEGNIFLNEGINLIWTLVCGGSGTPFNSANSYLGVGNGTTAESATQTGLQGTSKLYKKVDVGYPQYGTDQKAVWRATYGGTEANFAWNEFTVANGSSDTAINLNRKVISKGTKTSGSTWILTLTLTLS